MRSSFRKYTSTIKGRLIVTHAGIALLMTPVLIYSYSSYRKINETRQIRERVTYFNINRLKASEHFALMLDYDLKTDSFYLGQETVNYKRYQKYLARSLQNLNYLRENKPVGDHVYSRRVEKAARQLDIVDRSIQKVLELKKTRGFRDYGFEGDMREHIHRLEKEAKSQEELAEILSLRRREKDFFLRNDPLYVRLLNRECEEILQRLKPDSLYRSKRQGLLTYRMLFNEVVRLEEQIGNSNSGLIRDIYDASIGLENEYNALFDLVSNQAHWLTERIRLYITIFFTLTLVAASLLAFYVARKISRPIDQLVRSMEQLRASHFDAGSLPDIHTSLTELKVLAAAYSELIGKLREQFGHLHTKNEQLNVLNMQLKTSDKELREASQVKDKFFSIISHDLRGHAGNIGSLAEILVSEEQELTEEQRSLFIRHVRDTAQNLQLLLENLLNWAKSQMNDHQVVKKSFDLSEIIHKNVILFREAVLQKSIHLEFLEREVPKVYADKDMLDFAIRNLISNAIKFSRKGDKITIELLSFNEVVQVKIRDTGIGMNAEQVHALEQRMGESISRDGTSMEKGSGLGFATTHDFIQRNGGTVKIYSEIEQGSTILFTVPTSLTRESLLNV